VGSIVVERGALTTDIVKITEEILDLFRLFALVFGVDPISQEEF